MKQLVFILLLSLAPVHAGAQQEFTFEKQMEQAWLDFHQHDIQPVRTDLQTADGSNYTDEQFDAVASVMQIKDGYIRLIRKSSSEFILIHAAFLPDGDLLSAFRYAGVEALVVSTHAEPMKLTE